MPTTALRCRLPRRAARAGWSSGSWRRCRCPGGNVSAPAAPLGVAEQGGDRRNRSPREVHDPPQLGPGGGPSAMGVAITGSGGSSGSTSPRATTRARPGRASSARSSSAACTASGWSSATITAGSSRRSASSSSARRWQRCRVHFTRNAQDLVPRSARSMVASAIRLGVRAARRARRPGPARSRHRRHRGRASRRSPSC